MALFHFKRQRDLTAAEQLSYGPVDLPFLMLVLLLTGMGVITVFSASFASAFYEGANPAYYFLRQAQFVALGVFGMWAVSRVNYQYLRWLSVFILIFAVALLFLVKVPGIGITRNGANRWIKVGPVQFQPSEIAKVAVILFFSARLAQRDKTKKHRWRSDTWLGRFMGFLDRIGLLELLPYVGILLFVAGLVLWEKHMSGTILILLGGVSVLFAAGVGIWWFIGGAAVVVPALWWIMNNTAYMKERIDLWHDPWSDPGDKGYQIIQSLYAVGSGGLLGRGFGQSIQKFAYLPEEHNDFIFAIWCEEMGFIGALLLIALFMLLILRGYWLALHARDKFGALVIVGIITLLAVQVFLNIAVVTNLIPVTGISLPFFSYGGTALVIQLLEMGVVLSISRQIEAPKLG